MSAMSKASPEQDLRYPIGRFQAPTEISEEQRAAWIGEVELLPQELTKAVTGLQEGKLDTAYRTGGWTVRQVIHHLADSHMNSYVRFRLAMTEDSPTIKPYHEAAWAELADAKAAPAEVSLHLLGALHARWVLLWLSLQSDDMARTFVHPERGAMRLDYALGLYAWHGRHHVAQITALRQRGGW